MNRQEFELMNPEKLLDKIQELNKKLFKVNQQSPMFSQLRAIISEAQTVYQEHLYVERFNSVKEEDDGVISIGEIESEVYTPDYSDNMVLSTVVQSYIGGKK